MAWLINFKLFYTFICPQVFDSFLSGRCLEITVHTERQIPVILKINGYIEWRLDGFILRYICPVFDFLILHFLLESFPIFAVQSKVPCHAPRVYELEIIFVLLFSHVEVSCRYFNRLVLA